MIELCCEYLSLQSSWLYVIIMLRTDFRVNTHSLFAWMSRTRVSLQSLKFQISCLFQERNSLTFILKCVRDMIITYSQMHRADKYSHYSSIIWSVWPNGWVFVWELGGCGFESRYNHLNFRYAACLKQGVLWHSGKCGVWIYFETRTWNNNNIQSNEPYR